MKLETTPLSFGVGDYNPDVEYIKINYNNTFIVKPDWLFDGIPPEPRIFTLEPTDDYKYLLSRYIANAKKNSKYIFFICST